MSDKTIVSNITDDQIKLGFDVGRILAKRKIISGFLWFIGGVLITIIFLFSPSPIGLLFWGAILFGFYDMMVGISNYLSVKYKQRKYEKNLYDLTPENYDNYKVNNIIYENLSLTLVEQVRYDNFRIKIGSVLVVLIAFFLVYSYFSGSMSFDFTHIDEDFSLSSTDSSILIEYIEWEFDVNKDEIIKITANVNNGRTADFYLYGPSNNKISTLSGENVAEVNGIWRAPSSGTYTFSIYNVNNYNACNGHVYINWYESD